MTEDNEHPPRDGQEVPRALCNLFRSMRDDAKSKDSGTSRQLTEGKGGQG